MALEADRDDPVATAPEEQRARLERLDPRPEAIRSLAFLEVDVARGGVEGNAAAGRVIAPQELVDARGGPVRVGARNERPDDPLDDRPRRRLKEAELGPDEAQVWGPAALAPPGERRGHEDEALRAVGAADADLDCDAPAHAVADDVRRPEVEGVDERLHPAREEAGVIGSGERLVRVAEAGQVEGDRPVALRRQSRDGREELGLARAEAVN